MAMGLPNSRTRAPSMKKLLGWLSANPQTDHEELSVEAFLNVFDRKKGDRILDVRTENEITRDKISDSQIEIDLFRADFTEMLQQLQKDKTYYVYCRTGSRSSTACKTMIGLGFKSVYNIKGGISSWRSAHGPRKL